MIYFVARINITQIRHVLFMKDLLLFLLGFYFDFLKLKTTVFYGNLPDGFRLMLIDMFHLSSHSSTVLMFSQWQTLRRSAARIRTRRRASTTAVTSTPWKKATATPAVVEAEEVAAGGEAA